MCVICPVSSNTMTEVEMVCVTEPAMAAAPGRGGREGGREGGRGRGELNNLCARSALVLHEQTRIAATRPVLTAVIPIASRLVGVLKT